MTVSSGFSEVLPGFGPEGEERVADESCAESGPSFASFSSLKAGEASEQPEASEERESFSPLEDLRKARNLSSYLQQSCVISI